MSPIRLGSFAPDFTANSTKGTIHFHEYLGDSWGILFSHPADFSKYLFIYSTVSVYIFYDIFPFFPPFRLTFFFNFIFLLLFIYL